MAEERILQDAVSNEMRRRILRASRYRNELLNDEERQHLQDRIKHIRRQLKLA